MRVKLLECIERYSGLKEGWSSSNVGAETDNPQYTQETLDSARHFVNTIDLADLEDTEMYPRGYDGISFVWENDGYYLEVTIAKSEVTWFKEINDKVIFSSDTDSMKSLTIKDIKPDFIKQVKGLA